MSLDDIAKTIRQLEIEVERLKARETKSVDVYLEIAKGNVPGHTFVHKFGAAPDFDTADNAVTVGTALMTETLTLWYIPIRHRLT